MENRKTMMLSKLKTLIGLVLMSSVFMSCLKNDELNITFKTLEPKEIGDGLILSDPVAEGMNYSELTNIYEDVYADNNLWSLRSLLVFRNGKLVAESYLKDENDITNRHIIWSVTKQVMGMLTGLAIENGYISSVNDSISNYFDSELVNHTDKNSISISNLLTMQSGINFNNDGLNGDTDKMLRQIPDNSVDYILGLPINASQGTVFHYNDGNPHLMSALLQKQTGKPTDEWADEVLFSKIEFTNYNWVRYKDGTTLGAFGIETTPRELGKLALCVANNGEWKGNQIISSDWIDQMITPHVQSDSPDLSFGYYWWIDESRNVHFMDGHGGQFAFIVPSKDLVVVMTSFPNTQGDYQIKAAEALLILDRIINASN